MRKEKKKIQMGDKDISMHGVIALIFGILFFPILIGVFFIGVIDYFFISLNKKINKSKEIEEFLEIKR